MIVRNVAIAFNAYNDRQNPVQFDKVAPIQITHVGARFLYGHASTRLLKMLRCAEELENYPRGNWRQYSNSAIDVAVPTFRA